MSWPVRIFVLLTRDEIKLTLPPSLQKSSSRPLNSTAATIPKSVVCFYGNGLHLVDPFFTRREDLDLRPFNINFEQIDRRLMDSHGCRRPYRPSRCPCELLRDHSTSLVEAAEASAESVSQSDNRGRKQSPDRECKEAASHPSGKERCD